MTRRLTATVLVVALAVVAASTALRAGAAPKFFRDDPLLEDPETQDASGAQAKKIDLFYDLAENLFGRPGDSTPDVRARNINSRRKLDVPMRAPAGISSSAA